MQLQGNHLLWQLAIVGLDRKAISISTYHVNSLGPDAVRANTALVTACSGTSAGVVPPQPGSHRDIFCI